MSNFAEQTEHTLFASLGAGARFDRRRFGSDFRLFGAAASPGDAADRRTSGEASSSQASQASSVDFFGGGSLPTVNVSGRVGDQDKKTRKRRQSQVDEEATEDVVDEDDASGDEVADTPLADDDADDLDDIGPLDTIEKVQQFRNRLRIRATGNDVPVPVRTFAEFCDRFKVARYLAANLAANKYVRPTPIQMQAMPVIADGREVLGSAATGSGKTLAYLLPILQSLGAPSTAGLRVVIVVPTRELSQQIYRHVKRLTAGRNFRLCVLTKATASTTASLGSAAKFDILITTPMRLVHLVRNRSVDLTHVQHLVLDEGDKLLEMGFLQQVDEILAACTHPKLCRHLFSATMPPTIEDLARSFMRDPVRIVVGQRNSAASSVRQRLMYVGSEDGKLLALRQLTLQGLRPPVLIFVQSKERAKDLFHELVYDGINVDVIHAERTQLQVRLFRWHVGSQSLQFILSLQLRSLIFIRSSFHYLLVDLYS